MPGRDLPGPPTKGQTWQVRLAYQHPFPSPCWALLTHHREQHVGGGVCELIAVKSRTVGHDSKGNPVLHVQPQLGLDTRAAAVVLDERMVAFIRDKPGQTVPANQLALGGV